MPDRTVQWLCFLYAGDRQIAQLGRLLSMLEECECALQERTLLEAKTLLKGGTEYTQGAQPSPVAIFAVRKQTFARYSRALRRQTIRVGP